jgi:hypothetical protein
MANGEPRDGEKSMFNAKDLVDISDKLGLIQAVKSKLVSQPDPASSKLLAVLGEISKIYLIFEEELTRYLSLTLDEEELKEETGILLDLESGKITARMGAARGHCGKIYNIFTRYLSPWFKRALSSDEVSMMGQLFAQMSLTDSLMLDVIDQVSRWLSQEAEATLDLVERGELDAAQKRIAEARRQVLPARRAISNAMRKIYDIEASFIETSGAV